MDAWEINRLAVVFFFFFNGFLESMDLLYFVWTLGKYMALQSSGKKSIFSPLCIGRFCWQLWGTEHTAVNYMLQKRLLCLMLLQPWNQSLNFFYFHLTCSANHRFCFIVSNFWLIGLCCVSKTSISVVWNRCRAQAGKHQAERHLPFPAPHSDK